MRVEAQGANAFSQSTGDVDWVALGRAIRRRKWLILGSTILVAGLATIFVNWVTPKYKSEARVLIESRENAFLRPEADKSGDRGQVDLETVASQVQILTSRDLARQVIRELKLTERPEFDPVLRGVSASSVLLSMLGLGKDPLLSTPEERALAAYFARLNVVAVEKSRVISIEFQSADPQLAARVVNGIADTYLNMQQAAKREQTRGASQWLAGEIEKLRAKVAEAEDKAENFRTKSNLFIGANNISLANQQLTDLTNRLAGARAQKADLDARSRMIRDMLKSGKPVESADVANSELIRRLIEQRVTLRAQLAEQSSTLLPLHPRIQELKAQIAALDTQTRTELEKLVRSIANDARIAAARVETTSATLDQLKRQVAASGGQDVQMRALEREAKAQRDLLESYLAKYREATARETIDVAPADSRIISRASVANEAAFPKKGPAVLVAMLAAIFLAMTFVVAGELLGDGHAARMSNPRPARKSAVATMLDKIRRRKSAVLPPVDAASASSAISSPMAGAAATKGASIEELVQDLRRAHGDMGRIVVAGAARNVGTSHTAIGLARALARQGARVVLVDLALNAPNLSVLSINPDAPGLAELVRGSASFGDIITRERFSRVQIVASGRVGENAAMILGSPRLAMTLEALARAYDHVVIDAGVVPDSAAEIYARLARRAVMVARDLAHPATAIMRDRLTAAGFSNATLFLGTPRGVDGADTAPSVAA